MVSYNKSVFAALAYLAVSDAFLVQKAPTRSTSLSMATDSSREISRRNLFKSTTAFSIASIVTATNPDFAFAKSGPTPDELARIKIGYEKLGYLLDNFEQETTICRENGGECKRDADPVRQYLGLRSTKDPLFQIEKVFDKIKYMDIDPDNLEPIFEATEEWNTAQNMSNSMAFISQFGEYNPGGGKDEVLKYLEEAKKQVILARGALEKIIKALEI